MGHHSVLSIMDNLLKLGVNITDRQKEYLKWRNSEKGKQHFSQKEENEFWQALDRGDTSVIDVRIKETQDEIDRLRKRTGIALLLVALIILPGCSSTRIPEEKLHVAEESLVASERSYSVEDARIGDRRLEGQWYIISSDSMKKYRRNQQDLLKALKALDQEQKLKRLAAAVAGFTVLVLSGVVCVLLIRDPPEK